MWRGTLHSWSTAKVLPTPTSPPIFSSMAVSPPNRGGGGGGCNCYPPQSPPRTVSRLTWGTGTMQDHLGPCGLSPKDHKSPLAKHTRKGCGASWGLCVFIAFIVLGANPKRNSLFRGEFVFPLFAAVAICLRPRALFVSVSWNVVRGVYPAHSVSAGIGSTSGPSACLLLDSGCLAGDWGVLLQRHRSTRHLLGTLFLCISNDVPHTGMSWHSMGW